MRTFVAVEINENVRKNLVGVISEFRKVKGKFTWVKPENIHLTLKFLGEVDESQTYEIAKCLQGCIAGLEPFSSEVRGLGSFPHGRAPKVIWTALTDDNNQLQQLYERINTSIGQFAQKQEKRSFVPHITLGRVRYTKAADELKRIIEAHNDTSFGTIDVDSVTLMSSQLTREGPMYTRLAHFDL